MAKDPADRFASAAALADAARAAATGRMPVPTPQPTTVMPTVGPAGPGATGRAAVRYGAVSAPPAPRYGAVSAPPAPRSRPGTAALLRRPPTAVAGVAAGAVVAVLLGIGMTTMLLRSGSSDAEVAAASDTRGAASPSAAAPAAVAVRRTTAPPRPVHTLSAADYLGRPVSDVREELTALGLRVAVRQSDVPGRQDRVVALTPTHVREGETVTVSVTAPYTAPTDSPGNGRKWKGGGYHNEDEDD
jgi:serine/threonine-protein kinase